MASGLHHRHCELCTPLKSIATLGLLLARGPFWGGSDCNGLYQALPGSTRLYQALPGSTNHFHLQQDLKTTPSAQLQVLKGANIEYVKWRQLHLKSPCHLVTADGMRSYASARRPPRPGSQSRASGLLRLLKLRDPHRPGGSQKGCLRTSSYRRSLSLNVSSRNIS